MLITRGDGHSGFAFFFFKISQLVWYGNILNDKRNQRRTLILELKFGLGKQSASLMTIFIVEKIIFQFSESRRRDAQPELEVRQDAF